MTAFLDQVLALINNDPVKREQKLAFCIEKFVVVRMLRHFFSHGRIVAQADVQPCSDDEYVGEWKLWWWKCLYLSLCTGAVLTLAQEISRHVLGRACEVFNCGDVLLLRSRGVTAVKQGDVASIDLSRSLVTELHGKMLEFDFRNGPLRRKYDGLKYAVKNIEDISFELSLLADLPEPRSDGAEPSAKRSRVATDEVDPQAMSGVTINSGGDTNTSETVAPTASYLDGAELDQVRARMDHYDKLREGVIKDSRDVQKLAKQSIFAIMRNQLGEARSKLDQAEKCALKIMETVSAVSCAHTSVIF